MTLIINDLIEITKSKYLGKKAQLERVAKKIVKILESELKKEELDNYKVSYRIKDIESLSEKIIRNKYLTELEEKDLKDTDSVCSNIIDRQSDLIGIKIQCRFLCDEKKLLESLKNIFDINGKCKGDNNLFLQLDKKQPQEQYNGFDIYRIDGYYREKDSYDYKFELQIKSLVNSFWSDIEHEIIYKNFSISLADSELINELMKTVYYNLNTIDNQLVWMYESITKKESCDNDTKKMMGKIVYNVFHDSIVEEFKININISDICTLISEYYYCKSKFKNSIQITTIISELISAINTVNLNNIKFTEEKNIIVNNLSNTHLKTLFEIMDKKKSIIPEWNILLNILTLISTESEGNVITNYLNEIYKKITLPEIYMPLEDISGINGCKIKENFITNIILLMKKESSINVFLNKNIDKMNEITETLIDNICDLDFENNEDNNIIELHKFLLRFTYKDKIKSDNIREEMKKFKNINWINIDDKYKDSEYLKYENIYKIIKFEEEKDE